MSSLPNLAGEIVKLQALDWLGGDEGHKGPVDALLLRGDVP